MSFSTNSKIIAVSTVSARSKLIFSLALAGETRRDESSSQSFNEDQEETLSSQLAQRSEEERDEAIDPTYLENNSEVHITDNNESLQEAVPDFVGVYEVTTGGMLSQVTEMSNKKKSELTFDLKATLSEHEEVEEENINEIRDQSTDKKQRKRKPEISKWQIIENKEKRMKGEEYRGLKKTDGKWVYDQRRKARCMKPACHCKQSRKDTKIKCGIFTEEKRQNIFQHFWRDLNWEQRKTYVNRLIDTDAAKDKKNMKNEVSRRKVTLFYHLKKKGVRVRVCKKMFNNTLDLGEWSTHSWALLSNSVDGWNSDDQHNTDSVPCQSKNAQRKSNRFTERKNTLQKFFDLLPKLESHYCRASTERLYLEPLWQSKLSLYNEYVQFCEKEQIEYLSTKVFYEEFDANKLSLFRPRKDQCDICVAHKAGNIADDQYLAHIAKKNRARREKEEDKENATHIFTVDMQSVLLCPLLKASTCYYKKKLMVHNYTIYNLKNHDGFCFLWHEGEGGVSSNEFATLLYDFIENKSGINPGEEIILFSDGCGYQNRNVTLANALLHLSKKLNITIIQKYLVPGHTQMECYSMHSSIERKLRNQEIYTPAGYISACKAARRHPKPYSVEYFRHVYFKNFSQLSFFTSIRPGTRVGEATVNSLCALKYTGEGLVFYKTNFDDDWTQLTKRNTKKVLGTEPIPQLYNAPLAINKSKYEHLQALKKEIPHDYHTFYDTLKYE